MAIRKPLVKLAIVDDHNLFRKGLITLINLADKNNQYLVVFEAESGADMIEKLDKKAIPDILLLDIDMPDMDGFETVAWLQKHYPQVSVLVISMVETEEAVVRMVRLGVKGYLSKDIEVDDMYQALKAINEKGHYYTDFLTGRLIDSLQNEKLENPHNDANRPGNAIWNQLNENERRFIELACTEMTYEQIAERMFLSPKTIDGYRHTIFARFNIKSRVGLVLFAIRKGLVQISAEQSDESGRNS
jgi:two-component system, NarL family, invasion response regulator UvrY